MAPESSQDNIVGSGVCNPPVLFSTHPFFYENTLYTEFYNPHPFTMVFDTLVCSTVSNGSEHPVWTTPNILRNIIGLGSH